MPFAFIFVGAILLISGVRGTSQALVSLLNGDLRGSNNFIYWILSILVIGAIGYVQDFQPLSRSFLVLVIVVLVLSNDKQGNPGFFQQFNAAITQISNRSATTSSSAS